MSDGPRRHHDLRLLRRRLPPRSARARRAGRLDLAGAGRAGQQGPHLPQGPLRAPVLAQPRAAERRRSSATRDGELRPASWDEAIALIVSELTRIKASAGPDAIAGLASSRATNEDCYVMQRLMRAAIGTHNIDNCSRVCHSPTSWAMRKSLGLSGATGSFDDIEAADAAIIIGANPTEGHPVVGARIKQATLRGLKLVTIDPRRIELADYGVLHLAPRPGSNAAVMLGLAHVVARDGLADVAFLAARTEGWDAVRSCSRTTRRPTSSASAACPLPTSSAPRTSTAKPPRPACSGGSASPSTATAARSCGSSATSRSCAARSAGRAARCCRCAARTTSRARRTWARCRTRSRAISPSPTTTSRGASRPAGA